MIEEVAEVAREAGVPVLLGAMTPTEVLRARALGAEHVKIFPAGVVGPRFVKDLQGPFPGLSTVPSGGIDEKNARDFIDAGATAVCCGSSVVSADDVEGGAWEKITASAAEFVERATGVAPRRRIRCARRGAVTGMAFVDWLQNDTLGLLLLAAVSVAVLLVLIIKVKLEPFIALLIVGILTALAGGVSVADLVGSATGASESILEKGYAGRWGTSPSSSASAPCSARCWSPPGRPRCCWPG